MFEHGVLGQEMCTVANAELFDTEVSDWQISQTTTDGGTIFPLRTNNGCAYCPPGFEPDESVINRQGDKGCKRINTVEEETFSPPIPANAEEGAEATNEATNEEPVTENFHHEAFSSGSYASKYNKFERFNANINSNVNEPGIGSASSLGGISYSGNLL